MQQKEQDKEIINIEILQQQKEQIEEEDLQQFQQSSPIKNTKFCSIKSIDTFACHYEDKLPTTTNTTKTSVTKESQNDESPTVRFGDQTVLDELQGEEVQKFEYQPDDIPQRSILKNDGGIRQKSQSFNPRVIRDIEGKIIKHSDGKQKEQYEITNSDKDQTQEKEEEKNKEFAQKSTLKQDFPFKIFTIKVIKNHQQYLQKICHNIPFLKTVLWYNLQVLKDLNVQIKYQLHHIILIISKICLKIQIMILMIIHLLNKKLKQNLLEKQQFKKSMHQSMNINLKKIPKNPQLKECLVLSKCLIRKNFKDRQEKECLTSFRIQKMQMELKFKKIKTQKQILNHKLLKVSKFQKWKKTEANLLIILKRR
ncbi:hypothetical protein IMG5_201490 [Ichthyophthirius multifiliis]|uniref:Uncharacterized protein n=1 Tax=Ichthyophthirius multifiliis TaxID=5932 RepID=G0R600_ICHMU|nr:hypothetical protein IMG5_201490 [Ichthyophthirius multifiliis]EGR27124.1 hypothetical protein IMG5_201490 [Ichthyophthirius multifiliis]|eukprot:XP_004024008.1 hypothetical protein IMG5_201490 [Ichthyophthirius multifiliis]